MFDILSTAVPLEYRALLLIDLGVWGWGFNLHILENIGIDVRLLFNLDETRKLPHQVIYRIAFVFTFITLFGLWIFWKVAENGQNASIVTGLCYFSVLFLTLSPFNIFHRKTRFNFLSALKRVIFSSLRSEVSFGDVILADILTSFAKVGVGIYIAFCTFLSFTDSAELSSSGSSSDHFKLDIMAPLITALPFIFRLRQCISEYLSSRDSGSRHLANAIKYASAFPVVFFSALMHREDEDENSILFSLWLMFVLFNSIYSFYWDVVMDWDLGNTPSQQSKSSFPPLLRPVLMFQEPSIYYLTILLDFFLRTSWSLKLSDHAHLKEIIASGFVMEGAEIMRRWLWVYFRAEKEWITKRYGSSTLRDSAKFHNNIYALQHNRIDDSNDMPLSP
ncbi:protein-ER retention protein [Basidiobolus ranarum]|uniref:Protein-ER retention protein n=1 Tax=Basidiobolus ranarum TaxID=34480 RepID=A0ABR2WX89_9FUNG